MALKMEILKVVNQLLQRLLTVFVFLGLGLLLIIVYRLWMNEHTLLLFLIFGILLLITIKIYKPYIQMQSKIETNLMIENLERTKYIHLILNFTQEIEKTKVITRKRPWLFPKSQRIFHRRMPKTGFLELFSKVFIRNSEHVASFFQLIGVSTAAIVIIPPWWLKISVFFGALIVLSIWVELLWEKVILSHPLTKRYCEHDEYFSAKKTATRFFVTIGGLMLMSPLIASIMLENIVGNVLS